MSLRNAPWSWYRRQWAAGGGSKGQPPLTINWAGPSMTMGAGTWTTEIESPFTFVSPTFNGGIVYAFIPDGAGGWYAGGTFTSVVDSVGTYSTGYSRLVHLNPDGTVDAAFSCPVGSSNVRRLLLHSTGLYVAGDYASIGGVARSHIARVRPFDDASPGAVDAWNPKPSSRVNDLDVDGAGWLYIVGGFTSMGGTGTDNNPSVPRVRVARLSTGATGVADTWRVDADGSPECLAISSDGTKLYFGGGFNNVGSASDDIGAATTRTKLARVTTGASATLDAWYPGVGDTVRAMILTSDDAKLYIFGSFLNVGGFSGEDISSTSRGRAARLGTGTTATVDSWWPQVANNFVRSAALDEAGNRVIIGGPFTSIGAAGTDNPVVTTRNRVASLSAGVSGTLESWDPNVSITSGTADVWAVNILSSNAKVIIAGDFDDVANEVDTQGNDCAALEAPT